MSKRKREIKKRKKLLEPPPENNTIQVPEPVEPAGTLEGKASLDSDRKESSPPEQLIDDSQIVSKPSSPAPKKPVPRKGTSPSTKEDAPVADSWFGQNKENFLLGLLILYVLLLGLGTAGELFEIEWILNLPLFR